MGDGLFAVANISLFLLVLLAKRPKEMIKLSINHENSQVTLLGTKPCILRQKTTLYGKKIPEKIDGHETRNEKTSFFCSVFLLFEIISKDIVANEKSFRQNYSELRF